MTDHPFENGSTSTQLSMDQQQFTQLITTVAAALRQTTAPLSDAQQAVALQFRLLRNGLGRFESASEGLDRALLRVDQVHHGGRSELVFRDPISDKARSMVLVIGSRRVPQPLPGVRGYGSYGHGLDPELTDIVELIELLDQLDVPIAAGVPRQVQARTEDPYLEAVLAVMAEDVAQQPPRYSPKARQSPKTQES